MSLEFERIGRAIGETRDLTGQRIKRRRSAGCHLDAIRAIGRNRVLIDCGTNSLRARQCRPGNRDLAIAMCPVRNRRDHRDIDESPVVGERPTKCRHKVAVSSGGCDQPGVVRRIDCHVVGNLGVVVPANERCCPVVLGNR